MIHPKMMKTLSDKIKDDFSDVSVINLNGNIWFINPNSKYWYLQVNREGALFWREEYFSTFFTIFSLEYPETDEFLCLFVKEYMSTNIKKITSLDSDLNDLLDWVLNKNIFDIQCSLSERTVAVNKVIDNVNLE